MIVQAVIQFGLFFLSHRREECFIEPEIENYNAPFYFSYHYLFYLN